MAGTHFKTNVDAASFSVAGVPVTMIADVTASAAELNVLQGVVAGTTSASKGLVVDANKALDTLDVIVMKSDGVTLSRSKWIDVAVTAALLDAGGTVTVCPAATGDSYKVREIRYQGGGTAFGAGGDRLLDLTDGTTVYTHIANADIETASATTLEWGNAKVPFPATAANLTVATVAGQALRFVYQGGSADHTTGSITFSVLVEKVA